MSTQHAALPGQDACLDVDAASRARAWSRSNAFSHTSFAPEWIAAKREVSVSVCLPVQDEARTIGEILGHIVPLRERGVIDEIVVLGDSRDGSAATARSFGARVYRQNDLLPELGPVLGKGDAMWRALSVLQGEIVCFLDADSEQMGEHFVCGLLGPLVCRTDISFVKGSYRRPFRVGDLILADGGGRVTELTARPLLNLLYPELAVIAQPLAGEIAARRELLEGLPFVTGDGVDVALLIDAYEVVGLKGLAEVDLGVRHKPHRPLRSLGPMAYEVMHAVMSRVRRDGRLHADLPAMYLAVGADNVAEQRPPTIKRPPAASRHPSSPRMSAAGGP